MILYDGAKQMLYHAGIDPKTLNINQMKTSLEQQQKEKQSLYQTYQTAKKELQQMTQKQKNLQQYLEPSQDRKRNSKQKEEPSL